MTAARLLHEQPSVALIPMVASSLLSSEPGPVLATTAAAACFRSMRHMALAVFAGATKPQRAQV